MSENVYYWLLATLFILALLFANTASAFAPAVLNGTLMQEIKIEAARKYPNNLHMQVYYIERQGKAAQNLSIFLDVANQFAESDIAARRSLGTAFQTIASNASDKWGNDLVMTLYEINLQIKAAYELGYLTELFQIPSV